MQLNEMQFDLLKKQLSNLKERSAFYAEKYADFDPATVQTQ